MRIRRVIILCGNFCLNTIYLDKINKTIRLMDEYAELKTELLNKGTLSEAKDKRFMKLIKELKKKKQKNGNWIFNKKRGRGLAQV